MRSVHRYLIACTLAVGAFAGEAAPTPGNPEQAVQVFTQALRQNDLLALFKALPADQQKEAKDSWLEDQKKAPDDGEAKVDQVIKLMALPNAVDVLMLTVEPHLKTLDPNQLALQLQMGVGMLGMMLSSNPDGAALAETMQGIVTDLVAWLPKSGINDPEKARKALAGVVAAVQAFKVQGAAELKALALDEVIGRAGQALKELKTGFTVYGCDLDAFLDSVHVTDLAEVPGASDKRTATVHFTVLSKPRTLPIKLVLKDGHWVGDDSAVAPLLQQMGGGPAEGGLPDNAPAMDETTPVPIPVDQPAPTP